MSYWCRFFFLTGDIAHDMALVAAISVEDLHGILCVCENGVIVLLKSFTVNANMIRNRWILR